MKIKTKELLKALKETKAGTAKKTLTQEEPTYIFTETNLLTYNDQTCIQYPFESDFQCSIPATEFYDIISKIDDKEINLKLTEDKLAIKSKSVNANLSTIQQEDILQLIQDLGIDSIKKWKKLPEDFIEGVFLSSFSVSKDMSQPYLTCIFVDDKRIISSDNYRISRYTMKSRTRQSFLIPGDSALALSKFEVKEYSLGESWAYFRTEDNVVFATRLVNEKYVGVDDLFEFEGKKIELPEDLKKTVEAVSILAEGDFDIDKRIEVSIENKKIKCRGERDIGWMENTLPIRWKGKTSFFINPIFFGKILEKTNKMVIGEDRALFEMDNFEHLISLS